METKDLQKVFKYTDGKNSFLEFIGFDKQSGTWEFYRIRPSTKDAWYKVYLSELTINSYVKPA